MIRVARNGNQLAQGDVTISLNASPFNDLRPQLTTRSIVVGRGEKGNHEHRLVSNGDMRVLYDETFGAGQRQMLVEIPAEGARLMHAGHGVAEIPPGIAEFRHGHRAYDPMRDDVRQSD